jgi:hypothetical protein
LSLASTKEPLRYFIVEHPHLEGVGLSKRLNWTGRRVPDDEGAEAFVKEDAKGHPYTIERKRVTRPLLEVQNVCPSHR